MRYLSRLTAGGYFVVMAGAGLAPAYSQHAPATVSTDATLNEIIVTGSRIAIPNVTSTGPIQVVTEKDLQTSGTVRGSDLILRLPQNFNYSSSDFNNRSSALTMAGGLRDRRFELNSFIKPHAEFNFMKDRTDQQIAPSAHAARPSDPIPDNCPKVCTCKVPGSMSARGAPLI